MPPLRLLQVGLGPHGRGWARQVLPQVPEVDVVAYVDKDPYALDTLRAETGFPADRCFESLKEAVAATQPQAALNTTALPAHVPVTRALLEAGLHVMVEKPFAPSLAEAQLLVEEARMRDLLLMVSQNYRFFPAPRTIAAMVHESALGRLFEVSIDFRRFSTAGPNGRGRHHLEEQPLLVDMSIHHFDLLRLILSREPQRIYCEAWNPEWTSFSGPSVAVASIVFEGGVVVSYRGSWISAAPITPWAGEWRMEFENGEIVWTSAADSDPSQDRVVVTPRNGEPRVIPLSPSPRTGGFGTITEFVAAVQSGREPETSGRHNLGTIALMEAAVESATLRQPVTIHRTEEAVTI
ncbi:MAG TPA: Gfo/Idh/MocA family oxidoreductase [Candidatus Dormibacteraeota bacterium]|nr:Gfo/Idh/MocA family oxidoreductase [Candidatus Dormibacteraeota bacterium]